MYVTYAGDETTHFDRTYWTNEHFRLVRSCWNPHGLISLTAFFPQAYDNGLIAICVCVFEDDAAVQKALGASATERVMNDIKNFTDVEPKRAIARAF